MRHMRQLLRTVLEKSNESSQVHKGKGVTIILFLFLGLMYKY